MGMTASKDGCLVKRGPLLALLERCDLEAERLHSSIALLQSARAAFDNPAAESDLLTAAATSHQQSSCSSLGQTSFGSSGSSLSEANAAPVTIIKKVKKPGLMS